MTQTAVQIMRGGDFDADGASSENVFGKTPDSVFAHRNQNGFGGRGLSLTSTTFATLHFTSVHTTSGSSDCSNTTVSTPIAGDYGGRVIYDLGNIGPGQSKTVKFTYRKL